MDTRFAIPWLRVCDTLVERGPATGCIKRYEPDGNDAEGQEKTLNGINVSHSPQSTRCDIDEHDDREEPHTDLDRKQSVSQNVEQESRCPQLNTEVRNREKECYDNGKDSDRVRLEVIGEHLTGGNITEPLSKHPLPFQEYNTREGNGYGVERSIGILETVPVQKAWMPHERPSRKRCRGGGKHEDPDRDLTACDEIVGCRF